MKPIIISNWTNPDLRSARSYVTSYTLRQGNNDLFTIDLHKQLGFYQLSEFTSVAQPQSNFIIEQTNRVGILKISVFEKESAIMLGALRGTSVINDSEHTLLQLVPLAQKHETQPKDIAGGPKELDGVKPNGDVAVKFTRISSSPAQRGHMLKRLASWGANLSSAPKDIMKIEVFEDNLCDMRLHCAVGVILLSLKTAH